MKKSLKLTFILMIMSFGLVMAGCSKQVAVNLQNYVKLNAAGFAGKASFEPEIDINELVSAVEEEIGEKNAMAALRNLRNLEVKADIPEELKKGDYYNVKNGDKIKISFGEINKEAYLEQCGLDISSEPFELEVSGLDELEKVDIFNGLEIKCQGYDTVGKLRINRTPDELYFIRYELEKTEDVANGDKIKVIVKSYNDRDLDELLAEEGKIAESKEYYYTVSGLNPLADYDPLNGISLKFSGTNGKAGAEIEKDYSINDSIYLWDYSIDKSEDISNGDVITVTAMYTGYNGNDIVKQGAELGLKITRTTMEITAEGISEPLSDISMIQPEVFEKMQEQDKNRIYEFFGSGVENSVEPGSLRNAEYIGSIIDYVEPNGWREEYVGLYNIYRCDVKCSFDEPRFVYWYSLYDDVKRLDDGSYNIPEITPVCPADNYSASTFFVSGDIFTTADKKHFYVGFENMETLLKYKAKKGEIIFNNVDDSNAEHAKSVSAIVYIADKDGNTPAYETDSYAVGKTDVYSYGNYSIVIEKEYLVNPLSGLSKFELLLEGVDGASLDLNDCKITDLKLICDGKEIAINEKFIVSEVVDNKLYVTLFDKEKGVSGKKAAVKTKGFEVSERFEFSFTVEQINKTDEVVIEENNNEEAEKEELSDEEKKEIEEEKAKAEEAVEEKTDKTEENTDKTDNEEITDEEKAKLEEEEDKSEDIKEEGGTYTVTLVSLGSDRVRMIKTVMDYTGFGLQDSKALVDEVNNSPQTIISTEEKKLAKKIKKDFESYGATVEIK